MIIIMYQPDHLRSFENRLCIGHEKVVLSVNSALKMGDFVAGKMFLRSPSRKKAVFLDKTLFSRSASKKMGVCLDGKVADKKETPSKGCLRNYLVMRSLDYARDDISKITYSAQ